MEEEIRPQAKAVGKGTEVVKVLTVLSRSEHNRFSPCREFSSKLHVCQHI